MEPSPTDERVARLEERIDIVHSLLTEIREQQKDMADTIARASGGLRVLLLLGGLGSIAGALRGIAAWTSGLVPSSH